MVQETVATSDQHLAITLMMTGGKYAAWEVKPGDTPTLSYNTGCTRHLS